MWILKQLEKMFVRVPTFEMLEKEEICSPPSNPIWAALAAACSQASCRCVPTIWSSSLGSA